MAQERTSEVGASSITGVVLIVVNSLLIHIVVSLVRDDIVPGGRAELPVV